MVPTASPTLAPTPKHICLVCPSGKLNEKTALDAKPGEDAACLICPFEERCLGGAQCAQNYTGPLCGNCVPTHFPMNDACHECPAVPWGLVVLGGLALVGAIVFAHYDLTHWQFVAAIRQLFGFAQNVNLVELIRVAWPEIYLKLMTAFSLVSFNLDLAAPECFAEGITWHTRFFGMLGLFCATGLLLLLLVKASAACGFRRAPGKFSRLLVLLLTAAYASCATQCMRSFQATSVSGNEKPKFVFDPRIEFESREHIVVMVVAGTIALLVGLGLPFGIWYFAHHLLKTDSLRNPQVKSAYGGLARPIILHIFPLT